MSNEIKPWSMDDHVNVIRAKVREVLVASIPDNQMDVMIKAEFDRFFIQGKNRYNETQPSEFSEVVRSELRSVLVKRTQDYVNTNWQTYWDEMGFDKVVGDVVEQVAPLVQKAIISDIAGIALARVRDAINQMQMR